MYMMPVYNMVIAWHVCNIIYYCKDIFNIVVACLYIYKMSKPVILVWFVVAQVVEVPSCSGPLSL